MRPFISARELRCAVSVCFPDYRGRDHRRHLPPAGFLFSSAYAVVVGHEVRSLTVFTFLLASDGTGAENLRLRQEKDAIMIEASRLLEAIDGSLSSAGPLAMGFFYPHVNTSDHPGAPSPVLGEMIPAIRLETTALSLATRRD